MSRWVTNGADCCFVLDLSGSMQSKLHTLKQGVFKALAKLKPGDRFRFVAFCSSAKELTQGWIPVSDEALSKAREILDPVTLVASGGRRRWVCGWNR